MIYSTWELVNLKIEFWRFHVIIEHYWLLFRWIVQTHGHIFWQFTLFSCILVVWIYRVIDGRNTTSVRTWTWTSTTFEKERYKIFSNIRGILFIFSEERIFAAKTLFKFKIKNHIQQQQHTIRDIIVRCSK